MVKDNLVRLNHMLDAAHALEQFMKNRKREDLESDLMLLSALIRQLEIFGEAASGLSQEMNRFFPLKLSKLFPNDS